MCIEISRTAENRIDKQLREWVSEPSAYTKTEHWMNSGISTEWQQQQQQQTAVVVSTVRAHAHSHSQAHQRAHIHQQQNHSTDVYCYLQ